MGNIINITIRAFGPIREEFLGGKEKFHVMLEQPMSVEKIIREKLKMNTDILMGILINGKYKKKDYIPADGDEITLISPIDGG